jgi:uncharacterized protein DUF6196
MGCETELGEDQMMNRRQTIEGMLLPVLGIQLSAAFPLFEPHLTPCNPPSLDRVNAGGVPMQSETQEQAEARLLKVIANAQFQIFEGAYTFEELSSGHGPKQDALACVRDGDRWNQLVPASAASSSDALFKMFSFHFKEDLEASGFVGWLASHLKRTVGAGVIVICGKDRRESAGLFKASRGVFDYWGCPARMGSAVIAEIQSLVERGR